MDRIPVKEFLMNFNEFCLYASSDSIILEFTNKKEMQIKANKI